MFIVRTFSSYKDKKYQCIRVCHNIKVNRKTRQITLANISKLPEHVIDAVEAAIKGKQFTDIKYFRSERSLEHGSVYTILSIIKVLELDRLIYSRSELWREYVIGMIIAQIVNAGSKLSMTQWFPSTSLPGLLKWKKVPQSDDLYKAMDRLLVSQERIQKALVKRHLSVKSLVLYDVTSVYFEGNSCPLAEYGHSSDGKKGKKQIVVGLLTDLEGRPVGVEVFKGNKKDSRTLQGAIARLKECYGLEHVIIVGDRGMLPTTNIEDVRKAGFDYITALTHRSIIAQLRDKKHPIQMGLFDERNIAEVVNPDEPAVRYFLCKSPQTAERERETRKALIEKTRRLLEQLQETVKKGRLKQGEKIIARASRYSARFKVGKFFRYEVKDGKFYYSIDDERLMEEEALDGCYVITTNVPPKVLTKEQTVKRYKGLQEVERDFRILKTTLLEVRPIRHRLADRVKAHVFLCMLALYVQHEMKERLGTFFNKENGKGKHREWSFDRVLNHLSTLREDHKKVYDITMKTYTLPDEYHQKIFQALKVDYE